MNPDQIAAVRASWALVEPQAKSVAEASVTRLVAIDPPVGRLFPKTSDQFHSSLVSTLGALVYALDDPNALVAITGPLGRRHAAYELEDRHFDEFREALIDTLDATLGARFTCELRQAWTEAYVLVASLMLRAIRRERSGVAR